MAKNFLASEFQKKIGQEFVQIELLIEAVTHKSFSVEENKNEPHNERLEFLGDSILNFVVAEKLLIRFPQEPEGVLSKKRAALVNSVKLAEIAKKYSLESVMRFGPGEVKQGNHLNARIQGSCIEAIIGAIYLDKGFESARSWILAQYTGEDLDKATDNINTTDFKSRLQELAQKNQLGIPTYELLLTAGPSHKPQFLVSLKINGEEKSRAEGGSKKIAEQKAAEICFSELIKVFKES